ncbi:Helicase conserved domain containing protein [Reticulomyxa filosa]|uniref:Helicase conserved domain containing protein n=1 Tax=Reticulomyxa filosa TaxID=46433 RepID=X6P0X1_RETFI|nr:Helicase conserved domain containing protein [Reticulomyxa filosa]|eukprot:ETO31729.1 Helicase conserved domain containing protein [Reticulomyxa filosa]
MPRGLKGLLKKWNVISDSKPSPPLVPGIIIEAEARKVAEQKAAQEAEARKIAEQKAAEEAEAKRIAEQKAAQEVAGEELVVDDFTLLEDLIFDHRYFNELTGIDEEWGEALRLYKAGYIDKCLAPNREFDPYDVSVAEKPCRLNDWLVPPSAEVYYEKIIKYVYIEGKEDKNKSLFKQNLLKDNLYKIMKWSPSEVEGLIWLFNGPQFAVLSALASVTNYKLDRETIGYLKGLLKDPQMKLGRIVAGLLSTQIVKYGCSESDIDFLTDFVKQERVEDDIREVIFRIFNQEISEAKEWSYKYFDRLVSLLEYDSRSHDLARGLFKAQDYHGYIASIDSLSYFDRLIEDSVVGEATGVFICKSIGKLLAAGFDENVIRIVESYADRLLEKSGKLCDELTGEIFRYYGNEQKHFGRLVLDLVAEGRFLTKGLLGELIEVLVRIEDKKIALFIGNRLVQHSIEVPMATLRDFASYLSTEDRGLMEMSINLFSQLTVIPADIQTKIFEGLIKLLPKLFPLQYKKAVKILDKIGFTKEQASRYEIQKQVYDFYQQESLTERIEIIRRVTEGWNGSVKEETSEFFKGLLHSRNVELLEHAREVADSFFRGIEFSEEERGLNAGFDIVSKCPESKECVAGSKDSAVTWIKCGKAKFLLTQRECTQFKESITGISWDLIQYMNLLEAVDMREIEALTNFIKEHGIREEDFKRDLSTGVTIGKFYENLLQRLIMNKQTGLSEPDAKALKRSISYLSGEIGWQADFLYRFTKTVSDTGKLVSILERLTDYKVSPAMVDRGGTSAKEYMEKTSLENLPEKINQVISDNRFYISKDIWKLLLELKGKNRGNARLEELIGSDIKNNYFTHQLEKTEAIRVGWKGYEDSTRGYEAKRIGKGLSDWGREDFIRWKQSIPGVTDSNIAEVMAVLSEAAHKSILGGYGHPRLTQLLSLLVLYKSEGGGLSEIATGEGKSLIIACLAIIKVLQGKYVDIVTSSDVLARRDAISSYNFYNLFGIRVGHNIGDFYLAEEKDTIESIAVKVGEKAEVLRALNRDLINFGGNLITGEEVRLLHKEGRKECYEREIVYGALTYFIGDTLRDISSDTRRGRGFEVVIVDEVDNMFIDLDRMKVQLSGFIPGFEVLSYLLVYMRGVASAVGDKLWQTEEQCYLKVPGFKNPAGGMEREFVPEMLDRKDYDVELNSVGRDCDEYIKRYIGNFTKSILFAFEENRGERKVVIPRYLEGFAGEQLQRWLDTMISSYYYQEKSNYIIHKPDYGSRYQFRTITPIDYENTGALQHGLQWSDGLHQYLQIKHQLTMYPENVVSIFMSFFGFFSKYKGNIYGVSGTLGLEHHHEFLQTMYGVDVSVIPSFIEKDFEEYPAIVTETSVAWKEEILGVIKRKIEGSRAALIIVETIAEVEKLRGALLAFGYDSEKVFVYGTANSTLEYDVKNKRELRVGEIIIATNMAGRGTDLKISGEVRKNGGLHVIMGMVSGSARVEEQGYGRAARQGEPGSAQVIASLERIYENKCDTDIECLREERNQKEVTKLREDKLCHIPQLKIRDKLFDLYVELRKEVDSPTGYKIIFGALEKSEAGSFYIYAENSRVFLKVVQGENKVAEVIDITDTIRTIDPNTVKHIMTVISVEGSKAENLNKQAYEIIHFIAASKGYTMYKEIYKRVEHEFEKAINKEPLSGKQGGGFLRGKEGYLLKRLKYDTSFADLNDNKGSEKALSSAELRSKYFIWVADREIYNNQYELRQITDDWGIWLKQYDDLLREDGRCHSDNEDNLKQVMIDLEKQLASKFFEYKALLDNKKNAGTLMENPSYLVLKAWQYFSIANKQKGSGYTVSGGDVGWVEWITNVWELVKQRFNFGGENYAPADPLASAEGFLEQAVQLDDIYGWHGYNAKSYISLVKNGADIWEVKQAARAQQVKQAFCQDLANAIRRMEEWIIPAFEGQLVFLLSNKLVDYQDDLAIQLLGAAEVYKKLVQALERNIQIAGRSSGKEMIYLHRQMPMEEIVKDINITAAIYQAVNKTGLISSSGRLALESLNQDISFASQKFMLEQLASSGVYIFDISTYRLAEEKDWLGTVFAAVLGVASIFTGLWMLNAASTGAFGAIFGSSLVMQGVGDIIGGLISVGTGKPIDFNSYINSKGMSIGISLATAGLLHFLDYAGLISHTWMTDKIGNIREAATNPQKFLAMVSAIQVTTTVAGAVLYNGARRLVDAEDIQAEAKAIIDEMIVAYQKVLNRIFTTDAMNNNHKLQEELFSQIEKIVTRYQNRFDSDDTRFATGFATSMAGHAVGGYTAFGNMIGLGAVIDTGVKVVMGSVKNNEAMGKISQGTREAIEMIGAKASMSGQMLQQQLNIEFGADKGGKLFSEISAQGYVHDGEIDYNNCNKFNDVKLSEEISGYKNGLTGSCEHIGSLLNQVNGYDELRSRFTNLVSGAISHIRQHEIVRPVSDMVAGEAGDRFGRQIGEYIHRKLEESKQVSDNKPGSFKRNERLDEEKVSKESGLNRKKDAGAINNARTDKTASKKKIESIEEQNEEVVELKDEKGQSGAYTVKAGDSLWTIAKELDIKFEDLLTANQQISNPDKIYAGDKLNLPKANHHTFVQRPAEIPEKNVYTVATDDTLSDIARKNGITLATLLNANPELSKNPDLIFIGQKLYIPNNIDNFEKSCANTQAVEEQTCVASVPTSEGFNEYREKINTATDLPEQTKKELIKFSHRVESEILGSSQAIDMSTGTQILSDAGSKAKVVLSWYSDLCEEYPLATRWGTDIISGVFQTIVAGPAGAANALRATAMGEGVNLLAGEALADAYMMGVDKGARTLQKQFPGLQYEDAAALVALSGAVAIIGMQGASAFKTLKQYVDFKDWGVVKEKIFVQNWHKYRDIHLTKDLRLDDLTSLPGYEFMQHVYVTETMVAESMNTKIKDHYFKPPFKPGTKVAVFEADGQQKFLRVYNPKDAEYYGQFIVLEKDIKGLTLHQIKDKLDLPYLPTHLSEITPPKGVTIAIGIVKEENFGGNGLGTQFYLTDKAENNWFKKIGEIKND